jgi:hypothetical protein
MSNDLTNHPHACLHSTQRFIFCDVKTSILSAIHLATDFDQPNSNTHKKKSILSTSIEVYKEKEVSGNTGRAVAQRLDAGFPPRRPGFAYGQHVGFVMDKASLGQVFSEYFGFPCQSFHRFHHYNNHLGLTK